MFQILLRFVELILCHAYEILQVRLTAVVKMSRVSVLASVSISLILLLTIFNISEVNSHREIAVFVWRRDSSDHYSLQHDNRSSDERCTNGNNTYLVIENQCINNQQLLDGKKRSIVVEVIFNCFTFDAECPFAITPASELNISKLALRFIFDNETFSISGWTITPNGDDLIAALVVHKTTQMSVNNSLCNISSLEVYRGRQQNYEISKVGFSLSKKGTIEVR